MYMYMYMKQLYTRYDAIFLRLVPTKLIYIVCLFCFFIHNKTT